MKSRIDDEISIEELSALTNAIKKRYGVDFTNYEQKSLRRGFAKLISKNEMSSLLDLWSRIMKDREFFTQCIDHLTVNLTEFFRNPEVWNVMENRVLTELVKKSKISIWHAGCSTGEEVYSMATVIGQKNMLYKTESLATDLSATALKRAEEGRYPLVLLDKYQRSLQVSYPNLQVEDVFKIDDTHFVIKERYKKITRFLQHNLVTDNMNRSFDVIFCRNVMIYFDEKLKIDVINKFYERMNDDAFFVIGYYDGLPNESKELFELYDAKARIYKKVV